jgi:hypothetical protein
MMQDKFTLAAAQKYLVFVFHKKKKRKTIYDSGATILCNQMYVYGNTESILYKLPRGLRRGSAAERWLGSWVRIPQGHGFFFSCTVFVLSGRGLCDGPIPRPEEPYRL